MLKNNEKEPIINNWVILKGVFKSLILLIIISAIMAIFSTFIFNLNNNLLNLLLILINIFIITYNGFYVARRVDKNGWLNGGLSGLVFMVFIILLGLISIPISSGYIFLLLILGLIFGSIGGIIGINF
jgi:putative membrane protein (TIGR04086 family)